SRLAALVPYFEEAGLRVFNCTPDSGLTVFPHVSFDQAVKEATAVIPHRIETAGMYDRRVKYQPQPLTTGAPHQLDSAATDPSEAISPLPSTTLVIPIGPGDEARLACPSATWKKFKPLIFRLPILL